LDINNPSLTVDGLIDYMSEEYQVDVSMLSSGVTILYSDFMDRKKQAERKTMTLKKLVETVTKKVIDFFPLELLLS
jgi:ubiquitin-activating enzyme E1